MKKMNKMNKLIMFSFLIDFLICNAFKIDAESYPHNIFTIPAYNHSLEKFKNYTYRDIENYQLENTSHINMYTLFTQTHFYNQKLHYHNYNNSIQDIEFACNKYMIQKPEINEYPYNIKIHRQLYYYGIYKNIVYYNLMGIQGSEFTLDRTNIQFEIKGMYIIEDLLYDELEIYHKNKTVKLYPYVSEPNDFYRKMMLYMIQNDNKFIYCPLWVMKDNFVQITT